MTSQTVPVCEKCWIENNTDPITKEIKIPSFVMDGQTESCGFCAATTIVGIYSRENVINGWAQRSQVQLAELPKPKDETL